MSSSTTSTQRRSLRPALLAVPVAFALVLTACGDEPASPGPYGGARDGATAAETAPGGTEVQVYSFVAEDGRRVEGDSRITAELGQTIVLEVTSNTHEELHVHGYDLYADIPEGETAQLEFVADLPGVFEVELHHAHAVLTQLRVGG